MSEEPDPPKHTGLGCMLCRQPVAVVDYVDSTMIRCSCPDCAFKWVGYVPWHPALVSEEE